MIHCSIDIETFATTSRPAIVSIGAVKFDPDGKRGEHLDNMFYETIGWQNATRHGDISSHTMMWWLTQSREAIDALDIDGQSLHEALLKLSNWWTCDVHSRPKAIWSHTFDTVALRAAAKEVSAVEGNQLPWHYREERDIRTLSELWKRSQGRIHLESAVPEREQLGSTSRIKHHALNDAVFQADYIQGMLQDLGGEPNKLGLTPNIKGETT